MDGWMGRALHKHCAAQAVMLSHAPSIACCCRMDGCSSPDHFVVWAWLMLGTHVLEDMCEGEGVPSSRMNVNAPPLDLM